MVFVVTASWRGLFAHSSAATSVQASEEDTLAWSPTWSATLTHSGGSAARVGYPGARGRCCSKFLPQTGPPSRPICCQATAAWFGVIVT